MPKYRTRRTHRTHRTHDRMKMLQFIRDYQSHSGGGSPSYREIGEACGISSTAQVKLEL